MARPAGCFAAPCQGVQVSDGGFEVMVVRRSGPVQAMRFRAWWIYFLFLVLILMLGGLGAGSYLLYHQQRALKEIAEDTRLLMLRAERLESLAQEQETRALLAQHSTSQDATGSPESSRQAAAAAGLG